MSANTSLHVNPRRDLPPVSAVVPSYRRPDGLRRCLDGLADQTVRPLEVVVVLRAEDAEGQAVAGLASCNPRVVEVARPGQVAALNRGCGAATGALIAITDDDARPRPDWIQRVAERFASDPRIGAVGGRDIVTSHGVVDDGEATEVGRLRWWGRRIGNHHLRSHLQDVDFIKGANMSYRAEARAPFDERLWGEGSQICNDMEASWGVRRRGWRVVYDPSVQVDHYPAERHNDDKRHARSLTAECDEQHNELYALMLHAPAWQRPVVFAYRMAIGSRVSPGVLLALIGQAETDRRRLLALARARLGALATYRGARRDRQRSMAST